MRWCSVLLHQVIISFFDTLETLGGQCNLPFALGKNTVRVVKLCHAPVSKANLAATGLSGKAENRQGPQGTVRWRR